MPIQGAISLLIRRYIKKNYDETTVRQVETKTLNKIIKRMKYSNLNWPF